MVAAVSTLPYPISTTIYVYRDDGQWDQYAKWFMRPRREIASLFITRYVLPVNARTGELDISPENWEYIAQRLVREHPDGMFIYCHH